MNTRFRPNPFPQRPARQVTCGKKLTLWEPSMPEYKGVYPIVERLMLRLIKSELDTAAEAVAVIMTQMIMGTLGNCEVVPDDEGFFFTITWSINTSSLHDDTPLFIYQFLKEYALISPEHRTEAKEIREWIRTNVPLPF